MKSWFSEVLEIGRIFKLEKKTNVVKFLSNFQTFFSNWFNAIPLFLAHTENEMCLVRALERLGTVALSKEEPDIGAAFLKFSVVTKELSALMKTLMQSLNNIIMFPVDSLLKSELRGAKGELKKPFEKASKEYDVRYLKIEKEKKAQAKEVGMLRTEVYPSEVADEMEKERRMFQLQMCEYLLKFNEIKTKKGIELLQHLIEYYHAQHK